MTSCWHTDPAARPSFSDICISIEHIVDTAEHLPLPGQTPPPAAAASAGPPLDQPSPSYSNYTVDSYDDDDAAPLYRNWTTPRSPETSAVVD